MSNQMLVIVFMLLLVLVVLKLAISIVCAIQGFSIQRLNKEYIEPNENMTLQDCLDLYFDGRQISINNGQVTEII